MPPLELETEVAIAEVVRSVNRELGLPARPERSAAEGRAHNPRTCDYESLIARALEEIGVSDDDQRGVVPHRAFSALAAVGPSGRTETMRH